MVCLKDPVRRFIDSYIVSHWRRFGKVIVRERNNVKPMQEAIDHGLKGAVFYLFSLSRSPHHSRAAEIVQLAENGTRPKTHTIRTWLSKVEAFTKLLKRYGDRTSVDLLEEKRRTLGDMLDALGLDSKGRDKQRAHFLLNLKKNTSFLTQHKQAFPRHSVKPWSFLLLRRT